MILPVLGLLLASAWFRARAPSEPARAAVLKATVALACFAVSWTELLSLVGAFSKIGVAAGWLGIVALTGADLLRRRPEIGSDFKPLRTRRGEPGGFSEVVWWVLVGLIVAVGSVTLFIAVVAAPNNYDSLTYHLGRIAHWREAASIELFASSIPRQLYMAPGAEYLVAHLYVLGDGDRWVNLVQWWAFLGCVVGVSLVALELGAGRLGQALAAVVAATLPMAVLQATSTQNDEVAALWVVACVYFGLKMLHDESRVHRLFLASAVGLAVVTKVTTLVFLAPFGLAWLVAIRRRGWRRTLLQSTAIAVAVGVLSGAHFYRVADLWGNPLGPASEGPGYDYISEVFTPASMMSGVVRNLGLHLGTPWSGGNRRTEEAILTLHDWLGIDAADPRTTWPGASFSVGEHSRDEEVAGGPFLLVLLVATLLSSLRSRRCRELLVCALCAVAAFVLFSVLLKWQPWHARLHLPLLMMAAAVCGARLSELARPFGVLAIAFVLGLSVRAPLVENLRRPLLGPSSILRVDRSEQYFAGIPHLRDDWLETARALDVVHCREVGLALGPDDPEYLLWALAGSEVAGRSFRHVWVQNPSSRLESAAAPCAVVVSDWRQSPTAADLEARGYEIRDDLGALRIYWSAGGN